ncbi:hypothetical protein DR87_1053 [Francisella tularensis]|uniref:Insertion element IS402-like domain-containing protein n=1 Tax=Francisella tularensis TaxID=263 RepID=A0AAW3D7T7_FRATU|nr:hypothetical protein DR87_1053 [Francisella tularensis]
MNYHIKEVFWSIILSFLKSQKGIHTNDEAKLRLFIEAVFYVLRTGCQWRMLPFIMVNIDQYISVLKIGVIKIYF